MSVITKDWPRLTPEINKSFINFNNIVIDLNRIRYLDTCTLSEMAKMIGFSMTDLDRNQILAKLETLSRCYITRNDNILKPPITAPDVIVCYLNRLSKDFCFFIDLYRSGGIHIRERRNDNGSLGSRVIYNNSGSSIFQEEYIDDGSLYYKRTTNDNSKKFGPEYNFLLPKIYYYLHHGLVTKQEWLDYIDQSARIVRNAPTLIYDVSTIINNYISY